MTERDPRTTPARPDLAAESLRGIVDAPRFATPSLRVVVTESAPLRDRPSGKGALQTELLRGEEFEVYDAADDWSWGQARNDDYVGWLPTPSLAAPITAPTHRVMARATLLYQAPDEKAPAIARAWFASRLRATGAERNGFLELADGAWAPAVHLAPAGSRESDPAGVAERLLGAPYLYGGRTPQGIDCSALVQLALAESGIRAPRDADMQERELGVALSVDAPLERGDLVFWAGHVGMMLDSFTLLHANAHHRAVAREPFAGAVARIASGGRPLAAIRRIGPGPWDA